MDICIIFAKCNGSVVNVLILTIQDLTKPPNKCIVYCSNVLVVA